MDLQKLLGTFVDVGVLPQLANKNSQILYGRRGTGKTHVFKVFAAKLAEDEANTVVYIDARTLGSTAQFSDTTIGLRQRCLSLFRDVLAEIYNSLLEHIVTEPSPNAERALAAADQLLATFTVPVKMYLEESLTTRMAAKSDNSMTGSLGLGPEPMIHLQAGASSAKSTEAETTTLIRIASDEKVIFPSLHEHLSEVLRLAGTDLYVLIDEWSSLPADIQPYLAEFLKRGILPVQRAVLKIASLEYRSHFGLRQEEQILGFEVGSDIATALDLDDYYVFDRNPEQITDAFADMLLRHLASELPADHLGGTWRVLNGHDFASRLFTERETFKELVRASEGVIRDLINIFTAAFFHAHRRDRGSIDRRAIVDAARQWFEQDKAQNLGEPLHSVLRRIISEVIGKRRARSFLLPRPLEQHSVIQRLFDARVLHLMQRGYADKDNPGARYNIYTLDYGTYVDLMGTSRPPQVDFLDEGSEEDLVVPFDDRRSIRRIVLNEAVLS